MSMRIMQALGKRPSFGETLLQNVIVFLICVAFPGALTYMVPATWITFDRKGDKVQCTARTCVFFIVPYKTQRVDEVTGISDRQRAGQTKRQRKNGRDTGKNVHVDGEGFLQKHGGADQMVEVSVSPASLKNVETKVTDFLSSTNDGSKTIFAIANWKFGALMGGVLTSFTALYVVGYSLGFLKWIYTCFTRRLTSTTRQLVK